LSSNKKQVYESLKNMTILVTGGTGSFGKEFVKTALNDLDPKK